MFRHPVVVLPLVLIVLANTGCTGIALTALGVGGAVAANHQLGGIAYRTFSEPLPRVRAAVMVAFKRMAIQSTGSEQVDAGERIVARAGDRVIEVELEALTPSATRMRAVARRDGGILVDSATALEIITQTEKSIGVT